MILLAAALLAGDAWTWSVDLRYTNLEGTLLEDRERWTVRVEKGASLVAERTFLGTVVDDGTLVPSSDPTPETLKGRIGADGTLRLNGTWSDPTAARTFRSLLRPDATLDDRVRGWPIVRRATFRERDVWLPGGVTRGDLWVDAALTSAKLGGKVVPIPSEKP